MEPDELNRLINDHSSWDWGAIFAAADNNVSDFAFSDQNHNWDEAFVLNDSFGNALPRASGQTIEQEQLEIPSSEAQSGAENPDHLSLSSALAAALESFLPGHDDYMDQYYRSTLPYKGPTQVADQPCPLENSLTTPAAGAQPHSFAESSSFVAPSSAFISTAASNIGPDTIGHRYIDHGRHATNYSFSEGTDYTFPHTIHQHAVPHGDTSGFSLRRGSEPSHGTGSSEMNGKLHSNSQSQPRIEQHPDAHTHNHSSSSVSSLSLASDTPMSVYQSSSGPLPTCGPIGPFSATSNHGTLPMNEVLYPNCCPISASYEMSPNMIDPIFGPVPTVRLINDHALPSRFPGPDYGPASNRSTAPNRGPAPNRRDTPNYDDAPNGDLARFSAPAVPDYIYAEKYEGSFGFGVLSNYKEPRYSNVPNYGNVPSSINTTNTIEACNYGHVQGYGARSNGILPHNEGFPSRNGVSSNRGHQPHPHDYRPQENTRKRRRAMTEVNPVQARTNTRENNKRQKKETEEKENDNSKLIIDV